MQPTHTPCRPLTRSTEECARSTAAGATRYLYYKPIDKLDILAMRRLVPVLWGFVVASSVCLRGGRDGSGGTAATAAAASAGAVWRVVAWSCCSGAGRTCS